MARLYNVLGKGKAVLVLESLDALLQSNMSLSILPASGPSISWGPQKFPHSQPGEQGILRDGVFQIDYSFIPPSLLPAVCRSHHPGDMTPRFATHTKSSPSKPTSEDMGEQSLLPRFVPTHLIFHRTHPWQELPCPCGLLTVFLCLTDLIVRDLRMEYAHSDSVWIQQLFINRDRNDNVKWGLSTFFQVLTTQAGSTWKRELQRQ